ncbi:MAG: zinc ribbon domain-containing protein [Haloquadratum sp.]
MSKITFRADDELVERLESLDASKSEAMRDALRAYLDGADREGTSDSVGTPSDGDLANADTGSIDDLVRERVDELVADRLDRGEGVASADRSRDLNVNVTVDGVTSAQTAETVGREPTATGRSGRKTQTGSGGEPAGDTAGEKVCDKCGETVDADHVYCPNCGEKTSHRVFCECGDELRSDWAFCPSCGRRTSAADVLERT